MKKSRPHFLLHSQVGGRNRQDEWSFVLQAADGSVTTEANDVEANVRGERLELLAVVRGLEALPRPARVTLVTQSRYVRRGLAYGLDEWRRNGWTWESFGQSVPVKNLDLWRRVDRALRIHEVRFRSPRHDRPHPTLRGPHVQFGTPEGSALSRAVRRGSTGRRTSETRDDSGGSLRHGRPLARFFRAVRLGTERWKLFFQQLGTSILPRPWVG